MGWLRKLPIASVLLAGAMGFIWLGGLEDFRSGSGEAFEDARARARSFLQRHPGLEVDRRGESMLGSDWLANLRDDVDASRDVELPAHLTARFQSRLDEQIDEVYRARLVHDPAWRYGVVDAQTPPPSYLLHAFVHESMAGLLVTLAVLLIVGIPLELAWGSFVFGLFAIGAIPATAYTYRFLDAAAGVPWSGGAGLAAALLGAYFIRGLGGRFALPGWALLPIWLGVESFVVRGFWIDDLGSVPWASLVAGVGLGAFVAGGLRLIGIERRLESVVGRRAKRTPHPVLMRAARLRSDGDPYQAFDLVQTAWRETPEDRELSDAFYAIAVEVGQPEAAANAIVPSLRDAVRRGQLKQAVDWWLPLATREVEVDLEATAAVRLGEALLDAGHPSEAIFSMRLALDVGASAPLATRIVKIARDLDDGLARRAAQIALADPTLDPGIRDDLKWLVAAPDPVAVAAAAPTPPARITHEPRVEAEHYPVETTAFPLSADEDLESTEDTEDLAITDPNEATLMAQALDHGALTEEALGSSDAASVELSVALGGDEADDRTVLWSGAPAVSPSVRNLSEELVGGGVFSTADLESIGNDFLPDLDESLNDPRDAETDSDMTPTVDGTDELTSPLAGGGASLAIGLDIGMGSDRSAVRLRRLKALSSVPIAAGSDWLEIDVDERGKSRLPLTRIQAVAVGAVEGLGARTVLVIDLALNWNEDPAEPLKVIRFRSDRFDPVRFAPSEKTPLAALMAWVRRLQAESGAVCLPSRDLLTGRFERFQTLEAYEREVLIASARPSPGG